MNKKIILIIAALGFMGVLTAQQIPMYSQYMFNRMLLNPAVAGSETDIPIQLVVRQQWVGFDNAPSTQLLSAHHCFDSYNMGLGAVLFLDRFGHERKLGVIVNYAYIINVSKETKLALGLSLQAFQYQLDYTKLVAFDELDPNLYNTSQSKFIPESDFGIYLYNDNYFAGISANQMLGLPIKIGGEEIQMTKLVRHFNLIGGYKFKLNTEFELEPSILAKTTFKAPSQLDVNLKGIYQKNYWIGASYRTAGDIVAMIGMRFNEFDFAIATDFATSDIAAYQTGTFEIMLTYRIPVKRYKGTSSF
ncbi:MAG: type IX secretion system membrane protein PorP/SprF [Bacteroidales bacterium]|nr:type IX secretion system membrane protein PorP/SprF [Bacteroidales bacterium]